MKCNDQHKHEVGVVKYLCYLGREGNDNCCGCSVMGTSLYIQDQVKILLTILSILSTPKASSN